MIFLSIILAVLYASTAGMFIYSIRRYRPAKVKQNPPVSIIVAARNEEQTIQACVTALLSQHYPSDRYEIIIADDGSGDQTPVILERLSRECDKENCLRILTIPNPGGNKKQALETAIRQAQNDILLFTDADCRPGPDWMQSIVRLFTFDTGMVVGYSPIISHSNTMLSRLTQLDSLFAAMLAAGGIASHKPLTATGRNLAFRKQAFLDCRGYSSFLHSVSGDDDLLMHAMHQKTGWRIAFAMDEQSVVPSERKMGWRDFFHQKKRHISASAYYPRTQQLFYAVFHSLRYAVHGLAIAITAMQASFILPAMTSIIVLYASDWFLLKKGTSTFRQPLTFTTLIVWEWFFLFYHLYTGFFAFLKQPTWRRTTNE